MHSHLHHSHAVIPRDLTDAPSPLADAAYALVARSSDALLNSSAADAVNNTTSSNPAAIFSHGLAGVDQAANWLFANVLLVSFMGLLAGTMLYRWLHMGKAHMRRLMTLGPERDQRYWMHNHHRFWPSVKQNLFFAPLFRNRHNTEIRLSQAVAFGTLPSRFHTLLLVVYLGSNIAYCLVLDWGRLDAASVIAELRGRTGVLAAFNLLPSIFFALRNNPVMPLLHISYDTFNLLHRWCARMTVLEALVHTLCWAANEIEVDGAHALGASLAHSLSYRGGMVATCAFFVVLVLATGPIRHAFYETFLTLHRLLVLAALIGVYIHLDAARLPMLPYVKTAIVLWGLELVWRVVRIISLNISRTRGLTRITVEPLPAEACRVTFDLARSWRWTPGCHVHAYIPALALWSSHPFSVAWAEKRTRAPPAEVEMEKLPRSGAPPTPSPLKDTAPAGLDTLDAQTSIAAATSMTSITLIMRARTGMTRALFNKATAARLAGRPAYTTWGAIEGPYGGHDSLASYGTVLLFAGGIGITHCVGYLHHLIAQHTLGLSSTRKILLVWSIPNTEALEWVRDYMDRILHMDGRRDCLRIQLFVTKPRHRGEVVSNTGSVQMFPGRCNPHTIVAKEMSERIGAMAVTVCGPGAFADSVRSAARAVMPVGAVDFIEEAFTY